MKIITLRNKVIKLFVLLKQKGIKYTIAAIIYNFFKTFIDLLMNDRIKSIHIQAENDVFEAVSLPLRGGIITSGQDDISIDEDFIVGTASGILVISKNHIVRLLGGVTYGISRIGNRYFVFQRMAKYGRLISFELCFSNGVPGYTNFDILCKDLSGGVHQIDHYSGVLYIADTYNNGIIEFDLNTRKITSHHPNGKVKNNASSNYCHFNSIYIKDDKIYLLAHNYTTETGRNSEIYVLSRHSLSTENIIQTDAHGAHNIVLYKDKFMYCDSESNHSLIWGDEVLFQRQGYITRGISITDKYIVVGGSEIAPRGERTSARLSGMIWFLNHKGEEISSIKLHGVGAIQEIRALGNDYALSQNC